MHGVGLFTVQCFKLTESAHVKGTPALNSDILISVVDAA